MLREIYQPSTGETLDEAIVIFMPPENSLTGQPSIELHTHGSPALQRALIKELGALAPSFRVAEPGEFTRLAFEAGKLDLTEVEGLRDLLNSDTEVQRQLASRQAQGRVGKAFEAMRQDILGAMALVEAIIDFGEDESIEEGVLDDANEKVKTLQTRIAAMLEADSRAEVIRNGIKLALFGPPNAGKSTLLNWLAQREAAIVSSVPGTTRDVIELSLDLHGYLVNIADTAGLREADDLVESIGVSRAQQRLEQADVKVCVLSAPQVLAGDLEPLLVPYFDARTLILLNKSDIGDETSLIMARGKLATWLADQDCQVGDQIFDVSLQEGHGLGEFSDGLKRLLRSSFGLSLEESKESSLITQERHRQHLRSCCDHLISYYEMRSDVVASAEELRLAARELGKITGVIDIEEVLGEIFQGFCIGK